MPSRREQDPDAGARQPVVELEVRYARPATGALDALRELKERREGIDAAGLDSSAADLGLPRAHLHGAASFYEDLGLGPRGERHVRVCHGTACFGASGDAHVTAVEDTLGARCGATSADGAVSVQAVYCLGYCYGGPAALDGESPCAGPDLVDQLAGRVPCRDPEIPVASAVDDPVLLAGIVGGAGPWRAWPDWRGSDPDRLIAEVETSGLRGRGGAGFPAAAKWRAARAGGGEPVVIANGDEGDPGSYVDRLLMERDPHRILEGLALAGHAVGARDGWVYVRSEYPRAREAMRRAVIEARAAGHLGADFDVEVFEGGGSYVAGEETALIHSMEGLRGGVQPRPPYPTERGLLGRPTAVNNVETLAAVPWIAERGGAAYARRGLPEETGTKLVCLNEAFARPGAYEVEFGVSLRFVCEELGGGLRDGRELRALQVGGPLGGFLSPAQLDLPLSSAALESAGAALGHASLIALDDRVRPVDVLRHVWRFAAAESCGTCAPCRIGTRRGLERAEGTDELKADDALLDTMQAASLCAFGRTVPQAVRSLLRAYGGEA